MRVGVPEQPRRQGLHGWSLIELMLAMAIGLVVLAGVLQLVVFQIQAQRRLLLESRLTQELRTVTDLVVRDLHRSAYWGHADMAVRDLTPSTSLSTSATQTSRPDNPYQAVALAGTPNAAALGYGYSRDTTEDDRSSNQEKFGLRLNTATQAIEWRLSGTATTPDARDNWQALTDPAVLKVTRLSIELQEARHSLLDWCPQTTCTDSARCPPLWLERLAVIRITAEDAQDSRVQRQVTARTRLHNDEVRGDCPT